MWNETLFRLYNMRDKDYHNRINMRSNTVQRVIKWWPIHAHQTKYTLYCYVFPGLDFCESVRGWTSQKYEEIA